MTMHRRGYTLIEVIVVLAIITMLFAASLTLLRNSQTGNDELNAARQLTGMIKSGASFATGRRTDLRLIGNNANHTVRVVYDTAACAASVTSCETPDDNFILRLPPTLALPAVADNATYLRFRSSGVTEFVAVPSTFTLNGSGRSFTVDVSVIGDARFTETE